METKSLYSSLQKVKDSSQVLFSFIRMVLSVVEKYKQCVNWTISILQPLCRDSVHLKILSVVL